MELSDKFFGLVYVSVWFPGILVRGKVFPFNQVLDPFSSFSTVQYCFYLIVISPRDDFYRWGSGWHLTGYPVRFEWSEEVFMKDGMGIYHSGW